MKTLRSFAVGFIYPALVILAIAFALLVSSGCTLLGEVSEKAAQRIGKGVQVYCEETIPDVRETFREKVNAHAAPHSVQVTCADDTVLTTEAAPE